MNKDNKDEALEDFYKRCKEDEANRKFMEFGHKVIMNNLKALKEMWKEKLNKRKNLYYKIKE